MRKVCKKCRGCLTVIQYKSRIFYFCDKINCKTYYKLESGNKLVEIDCSPKDYVKGKDIK